MITPSFGLTATERVLPRLALDWTTGLSQSGVDVTRAGVATFVGSNGLIQSTSADTQRIDYSTGTAGLLVEESRTNLCAYSEDYTDPIYSFTDITIGSDETDAPDGATTADLWAQGTAGNALSFRNVSITVAAGATITYSVFAKRNADMQWLRLRVGNNANTNGGTAWFDLLNGVLGTVSNAGTGTNTSASMKLYANGFYRLTVTTTLPVGDTLINRYIFATTTDNTVTRQSNAAYFMWGEQYEVGAFPTSYIPTEATAVTRNADVATMTGTNFSDWFNASESTFFFEGVIQGAGATSLYALLQAGLSTNAFNSRIVLQLSSNFYNYTVTNSTGTNQCAINNQSVSLGAVVKLAGGAKEDDFEIATNTILGTKDISGSLTNVTPELLYIGSRFGGNFMNGVVRRVSFYPQKLTSAELASITK
jgi:hypothetical protein